MLKIKLKKNAFFIQSLFIDIPIITAIKDVKGYSLPGYLYPTISRLFLFLVFFIYSFTTKPCNYQ